MGAWVNVGGPVAGAAVAMAILLAVGSGTGSGAPEGWRAMRAGDVLIMHPKRGWTAVEGRALRGAATAAVLRKKGREVGRIAIRLGPTGAGASAAGPLSPRTEVRSGRQYLMDGRLVEKVEYSYLRHGMRVSGIDVVRIDGPESVRITAVEGVLRDTVFSQILNSLSFSARA
ncbi:hypothetical protein [Wenjunlia tyrosinilytica]|uniref:Uncharacterized protein n=1 Tax=Wenjunlia tyrosinilytica TaxID=1544741 RepID=A0A917ZWJ4_9ACTN|nr:hypothetical protein [Wenjunlia tyrosinilytica]GGO97570.1 hypothetical protein GCM10012280_59680 [Wenjunlia tyrosinilytica]